jgi:hypothetical protein
MYDNNSPISFFLIMLSNLKPKLFGCLPKGLIIGLAVTDQFHFTILEVETYEE